jgi:Flp pilus assembly pilin Flp
MVMFRFIQKLRKDRKGAALVEYFLIVAGVALIAAASVSTFGHKVTDLVAMTAAILPGAHGDDNNSIVSGRIIETGPNANANSPSTTAIGLDLTTILTNSDGTIVRLGNNLGLDNAATIVPQLVVEP